MHQLDYSKALVNRGNRKRIRDVMLRAAKGGELTIGFIGGSITQGSLASTPENCYAYRVYEWWKGRFPKATFHYVNAGIGATDSQFACARVEEDLLAFRPDFVLLEFAVNDESTEHYRETFEGVVRRILQADNAPALMVMYNVRYDDGGSAQAMHAEITGHYQLPAVSMESTIYPEILSGRLAKEEITPDDLHPNDAGHELVASVITYGLNTIWENPDPCEEEVTFPSPLTENAYESSVRFRNRNAKVLSCSGFSTDREPQKHITEIFRNGWTATESGASITFEAEGSCIAVQYRKTMQHPAPVATLILDQDESHPFLLDANFDETWGDKLVLDTILDHGAFGRHTVTIRLTETHEGDILPFYLVSVIAAGSSPD